MCARFALTDTPAELEELFAALDVEPFPPRYNIAPTQPVLMMIAGPRSEPGSNRPSRRALLVRWGLIPAWAKDPRDLPLMINARSETAAEKASFKTAMRHRRTLVPASGFYEWRKRGAGKPQPYWVKPKHGGLVAFAGLMETFAEPGGSEIDTGAILTTAANDDIAYIHDRMPVVIHPGDFERWLDCTNNEPRHVADLMQPVESGYFDAIPVSSRVNSVANVGPELQDPITEAEAAATEPAPKKQKPGRDAGQLDLF